MSVTENPAALVRPAASHPANVTCGRELPRAVEYRFEYAAGCNMCGSPSDGHEVLGRRLNTRQGLWPKRKIGIATTIMRCRRCKLVYANPLPIPKTIAQHYDVPPESYWTDDYFAIRPDYLKGQIDRFETLFGWPIRGSRLRALDVGAGIGKAMIALASAGFDVFGIEPSEPFRRRAIEKMGLSPDRLQQTTVEEADFAKGRFDFINMAAVLKHFYDPSAVLRKAVSWLRPGGLIHIEVPSSRYLMSRLARWFYRATGSDYVINTCPMHSPYHLYEFTPRSFQFHGFDTGYSIAHYEHYACESYMPTVAKALFNTIMNATNTGMQLAIWLRKP